MISSSSSIKTHDVTDDSEQKYQTGEYWNFRCKIKTIRFYIFNVNKRHGILKMIK